ncbi:MAG: hypothetical protein K9N23_12740 [Akkermansiaceae bacterium]|nr:hypothetical protein [Akkermansiaceae bacterium]MCF7732551.1 hypothetical protein [Akkermansiaceae bacterium]
MNTQEKLTLRAIKHLVTTARFKAYHGEDNKRIASLLDEADYICNLLSSDEIDFLRIQRVLTAISEQYTECSGEILSIEGN